MIVNVRFIIVAGLALFLARASAARADGEIFEQNGKALFASERFAEAAAQFGAAYTRSNNPDLLFNMALCYRRAGDGKRALGLYQRYLLEAPSSPKRTLVQTRIQELQQELAANASAAPAPAKDAATHEQEGKSLYEAERFTEAAAAYEAAYTLGKEPGMLFNMALCYRRAGDGKRALELFRQFLAEAPDTPKRASVEARIKELQQELAPAGKRGTKPVAAPVPAAKDAAAYERDGKTMFEAGRWAEAAAEFEGAYRVGKDPALLYNTALCHRRAGNDKRALELYRQYLKEVPDSPKRANVEARIQELQQEQVAGPNGAESIGCTKDFECKGSRVCEQGRCVEQPGQLAQSMVAQACDPPCAPGRTCSAAGACLVAQGASAADAEAGGVLGPKSYAFGFGLGYASGGSVKLGGYEVSPDGGFLFDAYVDKILAPAFSIGGYLTLTSMGYSSKDVSYQSLGVVFKARLALSNSVYLRPGLTLGYNRMSSSAFTETSTGMNIGMHVDLAIATSNTFAVVPRLGFFTQPSGGYSNFDVTFGPHFYLAFALEFGR